MRSAKSSGSTARTGDPARGPAARRGGSGWEATGSRVPVGSRAEAPAHDLVAREVDRRPGHGHGAVEHGTIGRRARGSRRELGLMVDGGSESIARSGWIEGIASDTLPMSVEALMAPSATLEKTRPMASALLR